MAFLDANVLAKVASSADPLETRLIKTLAELELQPVTYIRCMYELYSIVKGTTKSGERKRHPLKDLLPPGINDTAQRLFRRWEQIDVQGTAYFWFNLCQEWEGWGYFDDVAEQVGKYVRPEDREQAAEYLSMQKEWLLWKQAVDRVLDLIDSRIRAAGVRVFDYEEVFASTTRSQRLRTETRELARTTLLPNEDFDLVIAAIEMDAHVYVTEDRRLMRLGAASLGSNGPRLSFCHPAALRIAAADGFSLRFYVQDDAESS